MVQIKEILVDEVPRRYPVLSLLPAPIRKRIKALKKIQYKSHQLQANFFQEVHKLSCKYIYLCWELMLMRCRIVSGHIEEQFLEEECVEQEADLGEDTAFIRERPSLGLGALGVPQFWLTVLKSSSVTRDLILPHDEPPLRHLVDIRLMAREEAPMSFTLHFHFTWNPYFKNDTLTKEYIIRCEVDEEKPWSFVGPQIVRAIGQPIDWNADMDLTKKSVLVRRRHSTRSGLSSLGLRMTKSSSFFNFFNPPPLDEATDLRSLRQLDQDFRVGKFLREKLVPRAVLYFTGEAVDEDSITEESSTTSKSSWERDSPPPQPEYMTHCSNSSSEN